QLCVRNGWNYYHGYCSIEVVFCFFRLYQTSLKHVLKARRESTVLEYVVRARTSEKDVLELRARTACSEGVLWTSCSSSATLLMDRESAHSHHHHHPSSSDHRHPSSSSGRLRCHPRCRCGCHSGNADRCGSQRAAATSAS